MSRNKRHSYVSIENENSNVDKKEGGSSKKDLSVTRKARSFSELDLKDLVGKIYNNLVSIKESKTVSCNYNIQPYSELGEPADKILMSLRMCLPLTS